MAALTPLEVANAVLAGSKPDPVGTLVGAFDGVVGGDTPAAGTFTTLDASGAVTLGATTVTTLGASGAATLAAASVTTLSASGLATLASATLSGYFQGSSANGLTAVGTTRTDALQLAKQYNSVGTAASTAVGVKLPTGVVGMEVDVNLLTAVTAASIHVYALGSETIDTVPGATGVVLTKGRVCRYKFVATLTWESMLWGAVSA